MARSKAAARQADASEEPKSGTKPRPEGTKPLFINTPVEVLEALDEMAADVKAKDPMGRTVTRTDLVLKAVRDMLDRWRKKK